MCHLHLNKPGNKNNKCFFFLRTKQGSTTYTLEKKTKSKAPRVYWSQPPVLPQHTHVHVCACAFTNSKLNGYLGYLYGANKRNERSLSHFFNHHWTECALFYSLFLLVSSMSGGGKLFLSRVRCQIFWALWATESLYQLLNSAIAARKQPQATGNQINMTVSQ